jgi:hypothetical protein
MEQNATLILSTRGDNHGKLHELYGKPVCPFGTTQNAGNSVSLASSNSHWVFTFTVNKDKYLMGIVLAPSLDAKPRHTGGLTQMQRAGHGR